MSLCLDLKQPDEKCNPSRREKHTDEVMAVMDVMKIYVMAVMDVMIVYVMAVM